MEKELERGSSQWAGAEAVKLLEALKEYGIKAVIVMEHDDPIKHVSDVWLNGNCSGVSQIGMLEYGSREAYFRMMAGKQPGPSNG